MIGELVIGALFKMGVDAGTRLLITRAAKRLKAGTLDPNQDIAEAALRAHLSASLHLLESVEDDIIAWEGSVAGEAVRVKGTSDYFTRAHTYLLRSLKAKPLRANLPRDSNAMIETSLGRLLAVEREDFGQEQTNVEDKLVAQALEEVHKAGAWQDMPPPLARAFEDAVSGWHAAFSNFLAIEVKNNEPFFRIFLVLKQEAISSEIGEMREEQAELIKTLLSEGVTIEALEDIAEKLDRQDEFLEEIRDEVKEVGSKVEHVPEDTVELLLNALDQREKEKIEAAEAAGMERGAIIEIARRINSNVGNFNQALVEVRRAVELAIKVEDEGHRSSNLGQFVDLVLARIAALTAKGDFDGAASEAEDAFEQWQDDETGRREASRQGGLKLLEEGLNQHILRRDPVAAARIVEEMAVLQNEVHRESLFDALRAAWDEWHVRGRDKGLNFDLEVAIELARRTQAIASNTDEVGTALNDLGCALINLGGRRGGTDCLEASVKAFESALEQRTRERAPVNWGATQHNLGSALAVLGERQSGTARLEDAVEALILALEERTRKRAPLDWADTQNNLGNALRCLGARESGTERLELAVEAYKSALKERTRERTPLGWAETQHNLGNAVLDLGKRADDPIRLNAAVEAYTQALKERRREQVPLDWALTQHGLACALRFLGSREEDTIRLTASVEAFNLALEERTRERVPLGWAETQDGLGNALQTLGRLEKSTARIEAAVEAHKSALMERTRERVPLDWAATQSNLGCALQALGELEKGTRHLEGAVEAFKLALKERTREHVPLGWAGLQNNLGLALLTLGNRESGTEHLEDAVEACNLALEERTWDRVPIDWAGTQNNLGNALWILGVREGGVEHLEAAVKAIESSWEVYKEAGFYQYRDGVISRLSRILALILKRKSGDAD